MQTNADKPELTLNPGVKSRPQYPPVSLNPAAQCQVFIARKNTTGDKAGALLKPLMDEAEKSEKSLNIIPLVVGEDGDVISMSQLPQTISSLPLASSFYLAGTEAFIWDVAKLICEAGFIMEQVHLLPPVNNERRLFCTHCYAITEPVTHSPAVCSGCGRHLLVRDHFSKIHRAYVGVQIDAEDPADLPEESEELC